MARQHKYKSRKKVKGKWVYEYYEPKQKKGLKPEIKKYAVNVGKSVTLTDGKKGKIVGYDKQSKKDVIYLVKSGTRTYRRREKDFKTISGLKDDKKVLSVMSTATPVNRVAVTNRIMGKQPSKKDPDKIDVEKAMREFTDLANGTEPKKTQDLFLNNLKTGTSKVTLFDYSNIPPNFYTLFSENKIKFSNKPSFIPELNQKSLSKSNFETKVIKHGNDYYLFEEVKEPGAVYQSVNQSNFNVYKMPLEGVISTMDYYEKKAKIEFKKGLQERYEAQKKRAVEILGYSLADAEKYSKGILRERFSVMKSNKMTYDYLHILEKTHPYLERKEIWKIHDELQKDLGYKENDMKIQIEFDENTWSKGEETSYGDSGLRKDLLKSHGVKIKRQNGKEMSPSDIQDVKKALDFVYKVFGSKDEMSKEYGLKLSYSGETNMHARKAVGLFYPRYKTIGFGKGNGGFTLAHEYAHFFDNYMAKKIGGTNHYQSDNWESDAGKIATLFRKKMKSTGTQSKYWDRTTECFARALEQYSSVVTGKDSYGGNNYYMDTAEFKKEVKPLIDKYFQINKNILKSFNKGNKVKFGFLLKAQPLPVGHITTSSDGSKTKKVAEGKWVPVSSGSSGGKIEGLTFKDGFYFDGATKITNNPEKAKEYVKKKQDKKQGKPDPKDLKIGHKIHIKADAKGTGKTTEHKARGLIAIIKEIGKDFVRIADDMGKTYTVNFDAIEFAKSFVWVDYSNLKMDKGLYLFKSKKGQMKKGKKVEKEHTLTVKKIIKNAKTDMSDEDIIDEAIEDISEDHIKELPDYYDRLKKVEGEHK